MDGRELLEHIAGLKDNARRYLETRISYYGVLAFEKAVGLLTMLMANSAVFAMSIIALFFISGACSLLLGEMMDSYVYGMLTVGGFYLLLALILFIMRKQIFGRIAIKTLIKILLDEDSGDDPKNQQQT